MCFLLTVVLIFRRASALPNRGIHLTSSNWGRGNGNNNNSSTIITCGSVSNTSSPIITTIPTTSTTIATTKFTRLPGSQLSPRQGVNVTSSSGSIFKPTSITRVTSTSSLAGPNNSSVAAGIARNIPVSTTPRAVINTINSGSPGLPRAAASVPTTAPRSLLTSRNPVIATSVAPIRLTQTAMGTNQRGSSATSYSVTSLQRPVMQGASSVGGIRARTTTINPRFANTQVNSPSLVNRTNMAASPMVSGSALPSRPQSNPGLSSAARQTPCTNRPSSTGPAPTAPPLHTVRSAGQVRGFTGPTATGTFVRAAEGAMTVRPSVMTVSGEVRTAGQSIRQQPQQYLHMMNSPSMQVSNRNCNYMMVDSLSSISFEHLSSMNS